MTSGKSDVEGRGSLEQRVARLEDREAIHRAWCDYIFALDSGAWSQLADVFAEDATVEMIGMDPEDPWRGTTYCGRDSIIADFYVAGMTDVAAPDQGQHFTGHHGTNLSIDFDGDDATTLAYFFEILGNTQMLVGTYQHRLVRSRDRWLIAHLRITVRYRAVISAADIGGISLTDVLRMPAV